MPAIGIGISPVFKRGGGNYWATRYLSAILISTTSDVTQTIVVTITGSGYDGISYEYSTDGINFSEKGTSATGIYNATGLNPNTLYYWRARLYKGINYGDYSSIKSNTTDINSALIAGWKFDNYTPKEFLNTCADWTFHIYHSNSAQYYNGKTYIAYAGDSEDPYITTYTHATGVWATPVKIGTKTISDSTHGMPTMLIDSLGYIHVIFGSHSTAAQYSKSDNPEDISAWTEMSSPFTGTYPQLLEFSDGTIYMFYRSLAAPTYDWGYKTSVNGGMSWSAYTSVLTGFSYCIFRKGIGDTIHASINGNDTTDYDRYNAYYLFYSGGNWKTAGGTIKSLPVTYPDSSILVRNSGTNYIPNTIVSFDSSNNPFICFTEGTGDGPGTYDYKIAKYTGGVWVVNLLGVSTDYFTEYVGGVDVKSSIEIDIYLVTGGDVVGGIGGNFEKWSSIDGGSTWYKIKRILNGRFNNVVMVKDYHVNARVLFSNYTSGSFVAVACLYGDSGFITKSTLTSVAVQEVRDLYPGTISGTVPFGTGKYNQCYAFPGTGGNKITVADNNVFSFNNGITDLPFSITFWLNLTNATGTQNIITKSNGTGTHEYWIDIAGGKIRFLLTNPAASIVIYATLTFSTTAQWVFFAMTYTPSLTPAESGVKIYKNITTLQEAQLVVGSYAGMTASTGSLYLSETSANTNPIKGSLDEVKFWNKVLTIPEMTLVSLNDNSW